jgi:hypothetical protein
MIHSPRQYRSLLAALFFALIAAASQAQAAGFACTTGARYPGGFPDLMVGSDSAATTIRFARSVPVQLDDIQGTLPDSLPAAVVRRLGSVRYVANVTNYLTGDVRGDGFVLVLSLPETPDTTFAALLSLVRVAAVNDAESIEQYTAMSCTRGDTGF